MIAAFVNGLALGLGLILAIGAQNVFVLRAGLRRRHVFTVAAVSTACDAALIALGAGGLGTLLAANETLKTGARYGGALFVLGFAAYSLWRVWRPAGGFEKAEENAQATQARFARGGGTAGAVATALAFALLNPHVYVDTVLLLGGIGAQYPLATRWWFVAGAGVASTLWFFALAYGAQLLIPLFRRPLTQRLFDLFVAAVMAAVGISLLFG